MNAKQTYKLLKVIFPITHTTTARSVVVMIDELRELKGRQGLLNDAWLLAIVMWIEAHVIGDEDFVDMCERLEHGPGCFKGL